MRSKRLNNNILNAQKEAVKLDDHASETLIKLGTEFQNRYGTDFAAACLKHFEINPELVLRVLPEPSHRNKISII
jgi:hypothetical protein